MQRKEHWDRVYSDRSDEELTWYQPQLRISLALLQEAGLSATTRIIDVGGGSSTLVDDLVQMRVRNVTVLDVSQVALAHSRRRLGTAAANVNWLAADITQQELPPRCYDLWHDRAVLHFLTETEDRSRYLANLRRSLRPGGRAIICTFAEDGPRRCSGLDTVRYSVDELVAEFGAGIRLIRTLKEHHAMPRGGQQLFRYFVLQHLGGSKR
jgi:ubiquinone/menaquinone biosynthesis C-methylase UbiE